MATVTPLPPVDSLYALCRLLGPYPLGVTFGLIAFGLTTSVRRSALQAMTWTLVGLAQERTTLVLAAAAGVAARAVATSVAAPARASAERMNRMCPPGGSLVRDSRPLVVTRPVIN
jgi:hypothetical protein